MKILIVDDEKFNLVMAKDIIEANIETREIILCRLPEDVLGILAQHDIDIVLLDIIMPRISGIDILKAIRSNDEYRDIQVIMFTGVADKESFRICFENGADDYINKPIDITEFTARIRGAAKTRKSIRMLKAMYDKISEQYDELQAMTSKLKDAQFYLIQQEKLASLGEIAAGVAHEINNPIGFVSSNLKMLEKYLFRIKKVFSAYRTFTGFVADETHSRQALLQEKAKLEQLEQEQKLQTVLDDLEPVILETKDGVDRVAKIVQSLRSFARTGTEDELSMNDLALIVDEALLIIQNELKYVVNIEKRIQWVPTIICNKGQIAQVLINIFLNAAQAIKNQEREAMGNITVEIYQEAEYVLCKISDDGPGIKAEHVNKIFDPFFTTKEVGSGTGLGLSISYGIIKKHGGELLVDSVFGEGSSFIIKLPLSAVE